MRMRFSVHTTVIVRISFNYFEMSLVKRESWVTVSYVYNFGIG